MKTLKFFLTGLAIATTIEVGAQFRNDNHNDGNNRGNTPSTMNDRNRGGGRQVLVKEQPKPINVDRNNVSFKNKEPKVTAYRDNHFSNNEMRQYDHNNQSVYGKRDGFFYKRVNNNYVKVAAPIGLRIDFLPVGYINIVLGGRNYYYYEGTYYNDYGNGNYEVVNPPVGAIVYALPVDYEKVNVNGNVYYEYNGVLYERINYNGERAYQVVGFL